MVILTTWIRVNTREQKWTLDISASECTESNFMSQTMQNLCAYSVSVF